MACILLLIWHASTSSHDMHRCTERSIKIDLLNCRPSQYSLPFSGLGLPVELPALPVFLAIFVEQELGACLHLGCSYYRDVRNF